MNSIGKTAALAAAIGMMMPLAAMADTLTGNTSENDVSVSNTNHAMVLNMTSARSSTGDNYAGGSKGGSGGSGGEVEASGGASGSAVLTDSSGGNGGDGGAGSDGGAIQTGDASASAGTFNSVNSNVVDVEGCGCAVATSTGGNDTLTDNSATSSASIENHNDAFLGNGTFAKADTGDNEASGSRGGDVEARVDGGSGVVTSGTGGSGGTGGDAGLGGTIITGGSTTDTGTVNMINVNLVRVRP